MALQKDGVAIVTPLCLDFSDCYLPRCVKCRGLTRSSGSEHTCCDDERYDNGNHEPGRPPRHRERFRRREELRDPRAVIRFHNHCALRVLDLRAGVVLADTDGEVRGADEHRVQPRCDLEILGEVAKLGAVQRCGVKDDNTRLSGDLCERARKVGAELVLRTGDVAKRDAVLAQLRGERVEGRMRHR